MTRRAAILPGTLLACALPLGAQTTLHVPAQYPTVQAALDVAAAGDTVLVAPGIYTETLTFPGRDVALRGAGAELTTLVTTAFAPVVTCLPGSSRLALIEGFTITGGRGWDAGGIYVDHCAPTIRKNRIVQNIASARGGGIGVYFGSPRIEDNLIADNQQLIRQVSGGGISLLGVGTAEVLNNRIERNDALYGGGINCNSAGAARIEGNRIRANTAMYGGGLVFGNASDALVLQNVIDANVASRGGGIYHTNGNIVAVNNTIVDNIGTGSAVYAVRPIAVLTFVNNLMTGGPELLFGEQWRQAVQHVMANNLLWGPTVYAGDWPDLGSANGTVLADPRLRADGLQLGSGSPARDAGQLRPELPALDWFGDPRVVGAGVDIGADEYSGLFRFGQPCFGLVSAPQIGAAGLPRLGNTAFELRIRGGVPGAAALLMIGDSTTTWLGEPLPRGLQQYGLPQCLQLISSLHTVLVDTDVAGEAGFTCPIPGNPLLLGALLHAQWGTLTYPIGVASTLDGVTGGLSLELY